MYLPCGISVTKTWSLNKTCSDRSGKTITSSFCSATRRSGATRSPAAYSQGVALLSKAVAPTQRLSLSSSTVFFSRERVFVASARTYLVIGQRWRYSMTAGPSLLEFAIDQGYKSSTRSQAECCELCKGCQGTVWRPWARWSRSRVVGFEEVLQWLVVSGGRIGQSQGKKQKQHDCEN